MVKDEKSPASISATPFLMEHSAFWAPRFAVVWFTKTKVK
jgi:hypothetical protein